jgi:hypothetical protein
MTAEAHRCRLLTLAVDIPCGPQKYRCHHGLRLFEAL